MMVSVAPTACMRGVADSVINTLTINILKSYLDSSNQFLMTI